MENEMIANVDGAAVQGIVDRLKELEKSKREIQNDMKEIYREAKSKGLDVKAIKQIIRELKLDPVERDERHATFDWHWNQLTDKSTLNLE